MKDYIHKEFPKSCAPDDFMRQVKRTVNGKPIDQEQLDMIYLAINQALNFKKNDILLDLGCGNGALASNFFDKISGYKGVDFSGYMIEIAKLNFEKLPDYLFQVNNIADYINSESETKKFTKVLCYGAFQYFPPEDNQLALSELSKKFVNVERIFIGNVPDRDRADKFYYKHIEYKPLLDDHSAALGYWYSKEQMDDLARKSGWKTEFTNMPEKYYTAHYRYDVLLTRK